MKLLPLMLFLCIGGAHGAQHHAVSQDGAFQEAVRDFRTGRWSSAYGRLIPLANDGHRDAARMALFMHQYGPVLYGTLWDATEEDIELWTRTAGAWRKPNEPERQAALKPGVGAGQQPAARPRSTRFQGRGWQQDGRR